MSMAGSKARLVGLTKELFLKWDETKNSWRDAKAVEFERKYLQELFIGVDKTVEIVEKLDELLKRVKKDCE
jgi:ribonuclease I